MRSSPGQRGAILCSGAAVALVCVALVAGCSPTPTLTSAWPLATTERTVPKPPSTPRWPLTGTNAPSDSATRRRVISVKIENSPEARPQMGLNEADVVYETVTEGGITRFNTLWQSNLPKTVGPVRSARLSDLWIVPQYDALFYFSGGSASVYGAVKKAKLPDLSERKGVTRVYFRSRARRSPHNLYLRLSAAYAEARRQGYGTVADVQGFRFSKRASQSGQAVKSVYVPMSTSNNVRWTYNSKAHRFLRQDNGQRHVDALTGKQVAARNVVVMWARYTAASHDKLGSTTYDVNLGGTGRVMVFRDGHAIAGNWSAQRNAPPTLEDTQGNVIRLAPGNTWIEVIPQSVNITMR